MTINQVIEIAWPAITFLVGVGLGRLLFGDSR